MNINFFFNIWQLQKLHTKGAYQQHACCILVLLYKAVVLVGIRNSLFFQLIMLSKGLLWRTK